jgi:[ribosomal protein S18]-alanine N-acetyltransferase
MSLAPHTTLDTPPSPSDQRRLAFVPMTLDVLPLVAEVEKTAYAHPWNLRHFRDSIEAGHLAQMLVAAPEPGPRAPGPVLPDGRPLLGYMVAMKGVDEVHLLNITTAPAHQRQGWARLMLEALATWTRGQQADWLWLEVRASNLPALALYERQGFQPVGRRKGYYPDHGTQREDAVVMSWHVGQRAQEAA